MTDAEYLESYGFVFNKSKKMYDLNLPCGALVVILLNNSQPSAVISNGFLWAGNAIYANIKFPRGREDLDLVMELVGVRRAVPVVSRSVVV